MHPIAVCSTSQTLGKTRLIPGLKANNMRERVADFAPHRFSTRELPERHRLTMWHEEFGRGVVRVDIEPTTPMLLTPRAELVTFYGHVSAR